MQAFINERGAMFKRRFQFTIESLLIAVALLGGLISFFRPVENGEARIIDFFGPVQVAQDGSIEVYGGSIRIRQGNGQTEIRSNRIVVQKDGTAEVYGPGMMVQTSR
jgi:hypothetical protein